MGIKAMLKSNEQVFQGNKLALRLVREYMERMDEIIKVAGESDRRTKKITSDKLEAKKLMARKAEAMASAGALYAVESGDAVMLAELNFTYTRIRYAKDADALRYATDIEATLKEKIEVLGEYMVTSADLNDLNKAIKEYQELYQLRIEKRNDARTGKIHLARLFHKMDDFLENKLDRLMKRLGQDYPDTAMHYFQARKIDDR